MIGPDAANGPRSEILLQHPGRATRAHRGYNSLGSVVEIRTTTISGWSAVSLRLTSIPFISGMWTSIRTRSGWTRLRPPLRLRPR